MPEATLYAILRPDGTIHTSTLRSRAIFARDVVVCMYGKQWKELHKEGWRSKKLDIKWKQ